MQRYLLVQVPSLLLAVLFVAVVVGASLLAMSLVRRSTELESLESHKEVAGFIIAVVGALYAVLLGFVVVSVWEDFEAADNIAQREADLLVSLYRDADVFPAERDDLRTSIRGYAQSVIDQEWPAMAEDQRESPATDSALADVFAFYRSVEPQAAASEIFLDNAVERMDDVTEARRARLAASSAELPLPMWNVLIVGCVITLGFALFFPVRNLRAQGLMVGSLAAIIALMLFLVASMDLPFSGDLSVKPEAMRAAMSEFDDLDDLG